MLTVLLFGGPTTGLLRWAALVARVVAGVIFFVFGLDKFTNHAHEVESFANYGLPEPDLFVYAIGVLEIGGGLLLIFGLLTRLAALMLAGDMIGAIVVSGIGEGEQVSLTLAPALLVTMLFLAWIGSGPYAFDRALWRRR